MEWREKFNSFNSWKGLLYADWYKAIVAGDFLPPIEASVDPIHACNLSCQHCNASRYMNGKKIDSTRMHELIDFFREWGVKAICFGGGGEPSLHPDLPAFLIMANSKAIKTSVATNGVIVPDPDAYSLCRWVGISVDAGTGATYKKLKGADKFETVLGNMRRIVRADRYCDVSYKFLISNVNQHEIYKACEIARDIGVRDFHARPMDGSHQGMRTPGKLYAGLNLDKIHEQFQACHELASKDFRVFTVEHKFTPDWKPQKNFSRCLAAPLVIQICADGWVYFCVDQRHQEKYRLCRATVDDIKAFWGSDRHVKMVHDTLTCGSCQNRCTFGPYCEQCERLFWNNDNPMCWEFT